MSDIGREWTDEQIEELTKRFEATYRQAAREMQDKLERSLATYAKENEQRKKAMDDTPEARREYKEWKQGQAANQAWMQDMVQSLSESANRANVHAMDMINDAIPRTYSENANMAAFALEKQLGYDMGFTLVNEDAVRYLMGLPYQQTGYDQLIREVTWTPDPARAHVQDLRKREVDYPKDMRWNRQKFTSAITQGILQGESIPNIVKRTRSIYGMNKNSAVRAARTATTNAENAGRMSSFERAQALGIDLELEWLATTDGRTRDSHRALDGERIQLGQKFSNGLRWPADPLGAPSEVWNCFIGETNAVPLGCIERSFRHLYSGDAVTVKTSSGIEFTCTPNHPILTTEGWVAAGLLNDRDNLFVADIGNNVRGSGVKPDIKHVGTRLDAIHELLDVLADERTTSLSVYFHEDVPTGNVDVVGKEWVLRVNPDTFSLEPVNELTLELANTLTASDGTLVIGSSTPMASSDSLMSSGSKPRAFLGSGISHALEHGLRTVSGRDSSPLEPDIYDTSTDAKVLGESLDAFSAFIKLDHVVNVDIHPISAHVYNLQTESGAYLVNNNDSIPVYVIAHNCRCRANGRVVGFDGKRGDWADERGERWTRLPKGMTYDEWKKAKAISREESYKNTSDIVTGFWPSLTPTTSQTTTGFAVDNLHPETLGGVRRTMESMTFDEANELRGNPNYDIASKSYAEYQDAIRRYNRVVDEYGFSSQQFRDAVAELDKAKDAYRQALKEQTGYRINCQTCVVANEARRRGYDVEATPNTKGSANEKLSYKTNLAWIDPSTGKHPEYMRYDGAGKEDILGRPLPTPKRCMEWLRREGTIEDGARYTMEFGWKGKSRSGHIVSIERTDDGLRMYDPQCGKTYDEAGISEYMKNIRMRSTRYGTTYAEGPTLLKVSDYEFDEICDQILIGASK